MKFHKMMRVVKEADRENIPPPLSMMVEFDLLLSHEIAQQLIQNKHKKSTCMVLEAKYTNWGRGIALGEASCLHTILMGILGVPGWPPCEAECWTRCRTAHMNNI